MYCKIYLNFNGEKDGLIALLRQNLNASRSQNSTLFFEWGEMDISRNDEYKAQNGDADAFLYYKFILDVEITADEYARLTNEILEVFWRDGTPAVAACDYEEELIRRYW